MQAKLEAQGAAQLDLVLQQMLEEFEISELILARLGRAHIEGIERAAQLESFEPTDFGNRQFTNDSKADRFLLESLRVKLSRSALQWTPP